MDAELCRTGDRCDGVIKGRNDRLDDLRRGFGFEPGDNIATNC